MMASSPTAVGERTPPRPASSSSSASAATTPSASPSVDHGGDPAAAAALQQQERGKKRPRASKSLLVSFRPGSANAGLVGATTGAGGAEGGLQYSSSASSSFGEVASTSLPSNLFSTLPSSWSPAGRQQQLQRAGVLGSPAMATFGRDRSPSVSGASRMAGSGSGNYTLRRSRSNSNLDAPSALQRQQLQQQQQQQEDLVWKRKGGEADPRLLTTEDENEEEMVFLPHEKPSRTPGAAARPSPSASLEAIAKDRNYVKGEKVPFDEDREHEFKQLHNVDKPVKRIADYCGKYINAFLNTNGGVCYFGIDDDGVVYGVHLSRADRDAIRLHVDGIVESFWPAVDTRTCAIVFVPVAPPSPKDIFVMELHVSKGNAPVYLMSKNKPTAYMRRSGSIYQMSMEMILQRMNFTMGSSGSVFQPLQNTLTYKVGNVPRNFVGRQTELEEILDQIESSDDHVKVVSLYGQGGVGKTTLSRRIAAAMVSAYPDGQFCIQLNGSTPNPCKTHDAMLYTIRAFHPSITMPSSPTEIEGYYLSCFNQKRSVLLLDDAASKEQVLSLLPKSTCLVIVTSRRSLGLDVELGAVCVKKLGKLSPPEAVAMVQQMTRGKVTEEQAGQLAELCGYLPLAVQVVSATLAKQSNLRPEAMIQRLTENKGEILRLEGNTVELCIKASFELLSPRLQHLFLPLAVFPGSFDEEAAAHVLGVDAQTAQETLSEFLTNSLLEHNPVTWRYHLHFTVRVFAMVLAQKIEEEQQEQRNNLQEANMRGSGDITAPNQEDEVSIALWKERFVLHYHELMKRFQTLYKRGGDYILMGLELFDQNKHNVEEAMRLSITEMKRYSLFCSFAKAGQDIFRARLNQSKFFELYRDFLAEVKPDLLVTHRRGRGRGRGRRGDSLTKSNNGEDDDQEQELQDTEQDEPYSAVQGTITSDAISDDVKIDGVENSDVPNVNAKPQSSRYQRRRSSVAASISIALSGENESDLVEDDDLVFILNELGQAFVAQGQYHTAEVYYRQAHRISEKHFNYLHSNSASNSLSVSPALSLEDVGTLLQQSSPLETSAPIPIPRANSSDSSLCALSLSPPASTHILPLPQSPVPSSTMAFEFEDKRWRRNLATTLHNLGRLYGEQCMYTTAVEYLQRALELRQGVCGHLGSKDGSDTNRRQETEGKKRMRRGMEDREMVGESMLALGACFTQLGKYDEAESQFKEVLSLYRPATSSPLIKAITRLSPPSEYLSTAPSTFSTSATSNSVSSLMPPQSPFVLGIPNLDEEQEVEERERQRLRDELKLSKLGSTDSHGLQVAACLDHLGALLTIRGKYQEALSLHSTSLGMKQKLLGSSHLEVARTRHYLAKVLGLAGRYREAIEEYEVSLRIREDCLGPSHPLVANSLRHIAFLHFYIGEYTQAEKMYEKALKMLKDVFDRPHIEVAIVLNDLGLIYNHQSRYAKSQPYLRHSLAIRKKLLGKRHPYIGVVFNNLGNMYRKQRKFEMAEKYLMKALTIRENCFGKEHPEVARSLHNIAALRMSQKRYSEAQALFQRSLEIRSAILGPFHPELSSVHNAIGNLHECQKDFNGAIAHYNVALQLNRKAFGDYHPSISTNYYKLGNCYRLMKRYAEAEPMLQASRDVCFRCFGEEDSTETHSRSASSDRQRITPGHERILQSDDTLQKFYKEWAEHIVLQSREKRRLEDTKSAAAGDGGAVSPTASPTIDEESGESGDTEKTRIREARRRRRELRKKMKREGTWVRGMDEALMNELMLEEEEDEKFKRCIEVLKRMGREEDLAEVMRIEQRLSKLREHRRQRLEKERSERQSALHASATTGDSDSSDSSSDESDEGGSKEKKVPNEAGTKASSSKAKGGNQAAKGEKKKETDSGAAKKLSKKERVRLWKEREAENKLKNEGAEQQKPPDGKKEPPTSQQPPIPPSPQGAVVVITVRHLVALVLALVAALAAFVWFLLFFASPMSA